MTVTFNKQVKSINGIILAVIIVMAASTGWAADYYVDAAKGNDSSSGTLTTPWKTINKANSTLKAGDTVFIRGGTYSGQVISPANSGTASSRITYRNYNDEVVIINNVDTPLELSSRRYIRITGSAKQHIVITNCDKYLTMTNGDYNHFAYLTIGPMRSYTRFRGFQIGKDSTNNWVHHCKMYEYGYFSSSNDYGDMFYIGDATSGDCGYNLVEDNEFYHGGHNVFTINARYNVVRNNYFHNEAWQNGWAGRICELRNSTSSAPGTGGWNLIEGNRWGFTNISPDSHEGRAIKVISPDNIIRRNMFYHLEGPGLAFVVSSANPAPYADDNYVYNNVFFYNGIGKAEEHESIRFQARTGDIKGNVIKNNIFYQTTGSDIAYYGDGSINDNAISGNWLKANGNPMFVDAASTKTTDPFNGNYPNFQLQSGSPCIDGAGFLAKTRSAGSGTTIPVDDAHYFMNGWGIIEGDVIQLQNQTVTAKVVSVDYAGDTLTVDRSLTWSAAQGVSLQYKGNAPDLGAFESGMTGGGGAQLLPPSNLRIQ